MSRYHKITRVGNKYIVSNSSTGAVSIFDEAELVMFLLYPAGNLKPLRTFLHQLGCSAEDIVSEISRFESRLKAEGWMRNQLPPNSGVLIESIYLNVTNACNYNCVYCYQGKAQNGNNLRGFISEENAKSILMKIKTANPACKVIVTGGEPFLHPNIFDVLSLIEDAKMQFSVLTNGSLIDDDCALAMARYRHLVNVQVSLDGMTEEVHSMTRGKTFHKTMKGIKAIMKYNVPFSLAPTMHDDNLDDMVQIAHFALKNGGGFTPNNLRKFPHCSAPGFILKNDNFLETITRVEDALIETFGNVFVLNQKLRCFINRTTNRDHFICGVGYSVIDIDWNGDVYPCHLLRKVDFLLGNIIEEEIETIVNKTVDLSIRKNTHEIDKCKSCDFMSLCGGGCRAAAYYEHGTFAREDPLCDILYKNELHYLKHEEE